MYDDANPAIQRLRAICLALPDAFEKEAWGECTFRVTGGSMFAMTDNNHHASGHVAVWVKAPPTVQEILVHADAQRFFVPPYMGPKGWVGVRLDYKVDWDELAGILKDGYLMSAPKRLRGRVLPALDEVASTSDIAKTRRAAPMPRTTTRPRSKKTTSRRRRDTR
ncbi:MAG TPA: MmcQ/YjbR family DNA-binding protein [Candidatus Kryptonia bacterium]|nr:MmcQ/YjbR family DNA-binding protein [Candidatus Kryptonia bacterium]